MKQMLIMVLVLLFMGMALAACAAPADAQYADPFSYCAAIRTIDTPDARFTGPNPPGAVVTGLMKAMGLSSDAPAEPVAQSMSWRCMDRKVYACTVGANIPCQEKADTSKTPSAAMNDFCKQNPTANVIPAAVTGRATVYEWNCVNGTATAGKQFTQPDAQGYLALYWYEIPK